MDYISCFSISNYKFKMVPYTPLPEESDYPVAYLAWYDSLPADHWSQYARVAYKYFRDRGYRMFMTSGYARTRSLNRRGVFDVSASTFRRDTSSTLEWGRRKYMSSNRKFLLRIMYVLYEVYRSNTFSRYRLHEWCRSYDRQFTLYP